ncbi:MAG: PQQ-binding-like beta-propeller repeat protein [Candidatus Dormibacteria bacterium]
MDTSYAINERDGTQRWSFTLDSQPAVKPVPGNRQPADATTDGGIVTSTAYFVPGDTTQPDLVIFGGGFTLYALRADTGALYWKHVYSGKPEAPPDPDSDPTRIFSSPAVVGDDVLFGVSPDGTAGYRGYMAAADLATGEPRWRLELDGTDATGAPRDDGCGNVWASPTIDLAKNVEIVGTADCNAQAATSPHAEHVLGVRIGDGTIAWEFVPPREQRSDPACDFDFGATANLGVDASGDAGFIGVGGKDSTYYSLDAADPAAPPRWSTNVVFGGTSGGFLGSTAYDGARVYGATAIGDFNPGGTGCEPADPNDTAVQEPSMHSLNPASGAVMWEQDASQSLGPTTDAAGMTFAGAALARRLEVYDAASGTPVAAIPGVNSDSGVVPSGNALFLGIGSSEQGAGDGVLALTPSGVQPASEPAAEAAEWPGFAPAAVLVSTGVGVVAWRRLGRRTSRRRPDAGVVAS